MDYYYRKTTDLLNSVFVSAGTNFKNKVLSNVGSLENSGIEFSINSKPVVTTDWTWDLGFNITYNKNEITKLTTGDSENYYVAAGDNIGGGRDMKAMAHAVGHPASSFYVYQQVYDENGKPIENEFVDRNGDGTINGDDRYFYKKPTADVLMGLTSRLSYKSWDFSFSLRASLNNYVYNSVEAGGSDCNPTSVYSFGALNNRPLMGVANNIQSKNDNTLLSDYFVQNASFMKCDNITLGYSFKKLFGAPIGGRVYAAVQNVFTITKYKGLDPEVEKGLDNNIYPRPLTTLIGLSLISKPTKIPIMKFRYIKSILSAASLLLAVSVTSCIGDLDATPIDPNIVMTFDQASVFNKIYGTLGLTGQKGPDGSGDLDDIDEGTSSFYRMTWCANQLMTDEAIVNSWNDAGVATIADCSWSSSNEIVTGLYYRLTFDITLCNYFLEQTEGLTDDETTRQRAEVRFIRALNNYYLMDMFGNPPYCDKVSTEKPQQIQRADLFAKIEEELKEIGDDATATLAQPLQTTYGRVDRVAAWLLLARMYLNAEVYTGTPQWGKAKEYARR